MRMISATYLLTCFLLSYIQFAVRITGDTDTSTQCPANCTCDSSSTATSLVVDCQRRQDIDTKQLSDELDTMLSSNLTYGRLLSLSIVNSSLTHVPRSICRLTTLRVLRLDNNQLTRLPDNCLTNLSNLIRFTASNNAIATLQDGVFDGLTKLRHLDISKNRISSIGVSVFATSSNLFNLFFIFLSENNLTSLDPWIYDRGIIGSFYHKVYISLSLNKISEFTNKIGHDFRGHYGLCSTKMPYAYIDLSDNKVRHFQDIWTGWQMDGEGLINCYRIVNDVLNVIIITNNNNIMCDYIDYNFYKIIGLHALLHHWTSLSLILNCDLTDPLTIQSRTVNGFELDLNLFLCKITERCPSECVCVHRPANATLHVYCSNNNLTVLPLELPELPDSRTKYKLDFSNNKLLRRLEYRDYFVNTSILDVSNCSVDDVSD